MENLSFENADKDLTETAYLLSNPANTKYLLGSIAQDKHNQIYQLNLTDLEVDFDKEK